MSLISSYAWCDKHCLGSKRNQRSGEVSNRAQQPREEYYIPFFRFKHLIKVQAIINDVSRQWDGKLVIRIVDSISQLSIVQTSAA